MVYSLTYRRPSHVSSSRDSLTGEEKQQSINESLSSGSSSLSKGIPEALSFDRIVANGACPVSSILHQGFIALELTNLETAMYCPGLHELSQVHRAFC
jgi:hypothetical protein